MSKELDNITEGVMNKINRGQIKMRPKLYFILGYFLALGGLVFSFITSIFFVGLIRFSLRSHGPMGPYRLEQMLSSFSWYMPVLAILGLIIGIYLLRKYDFSYKINFKLFVIGLIAFVLIAGWIIDMTGLNDFWLRRGQGQGYGQRQVIKINNFSNLQ